MPYPNDAFLQTQQDNSVSLKSAHRQGEQQHNSRIGPLAEASRLNGWSPGWFPADAPRCWHSHHLGSPPRRSTSAAGAAPKHAQRSRSPKSRGDAVARLRPADRGCAAEGPCRRRVRSRGGAARGEGAIHHMQIDSNIPCRTQPCINVPS